MKTEKQFKERRLRQALQARKAAIISLNALNVTIEKYDKIIEKLKGVI